MKLEKKHYWIIIAVIVAIAVWYFFLRNKESKYDPFTSDVFGTDDGSAPVMDSLESSFGRGGGGMGRHGGFFHGGRGRWGGGYGYGYPYYGGYPYPYYDDEPIIVRGSTKCPNGWIWMGAMLGCQKPQGL